MNCSSKKRLKTEMIPVRMSQMDKEIIKKNAVKSDKTISEYLRDKGLNSELQKITVDEASGLMRMHQIINDLRRLIIEEGSDYMKSQLNEILYANKMGGDQR